MSDISGYLEPVVRVHADLIKLVRAGGEAGVTSTEARFLVDLYYTVQKTRIRVNNQAKGLDRDAEESGTEAEPHEALLWVLGQFELMEKQIARLLTAYVEAHEMNWFFAQTLGVNTGVLAAGLLAHIDIRKAPTAGHIYRFAGLEPSQVWCSKEQAAAIWKECKGETKLDRLDRAAEKIGRNPVNLLHMATHKPDGSEIPLTDASAVAAIARKPFNGALKTLLWKIGDSFMKLSKRPDAFYGQIYRRRKAYEWDRNLSGGNAGAAAKSLAEKNYGKSTDAYAWLSGACDPAKAKVKIDAGEPLTVAACKSDAGVPMLPPAQIDARARRYAVKMFISHLQYRWYEVEFGELPPNPYPIAKDGHAHFIAPPQLRPALDQAA